MKINKNDLLRIIASTDSNEINLVEIIPNNVKVKRVDSNGDMIDGFYKRGDGSVLIIERSKELDLNEELVRLDSSPSLIKKSGSFHELATRGKSIGPKLEVEFELSNIDLEVKPLKPNLTKDRSFNAKYYSLLENSFVEKELTIPSKRYGDKWKSDKDVILDWSLKSTIKSIIGVHDGSICRDYFVLDCSDIDISFQGECQYIIKSVLGYPSINSYEIFSKLLYSIYQLGVGINYIFVLMTRSAIIEDCYFDLTVSELSSIFNKSFLDKLRKAYSTLDEENHQFIEYLDYCRYSLLETKSELTVRELIKEKAMFDY